MKTNNPSISGISSDIKSENIGDSLVEFFKSLGYKVDWDFSAKHGSTWHEIIDPESGKLAMQVEMGVSLDRFLKCFQNPETDDFFWSGDPENEVTKKLDDKIKQYLKNENTINS